jgi:hypothetical protein
MITRIVSIALISAQLFCMDVPLCSLAQKDDLPGILELYTTSNDKEKIVFLPPQAREEALCKAIDLQRLCVTKINGNITAVALKKENHV